MNEQDIRPFSAVVSLVTDRVSAAKDRSMAYVGLEHIPSNGTSIKETGTAADSISTNGVFAPGDILFGKLRPRLRKSVRATHAGYCSTDVLVLRALPGVDPRFAGYVAQSDEVFRRAIQTEEGTKMPRCSWHDLRAAPVYLPSSVDTQRRIAAVLTSFDNAIEATEALIEKHQQIKAGLMQDLFARGMGSNGVLRVAGGTRGFHSTRLGVLPADWSVLPLQKCLAEGATNGIYKPPHLIGSGTLLFGQTAITEDRSVDSNLARRAVATPGDIRRFGLAAGDILVARVFATVEGVGRPALVPELGEPALFESNMMRLRVAESIIRPRLLFEWLQSDASRRYIEGRANASNQVSVNQAVLYPLPVPVPPPDEQDRMVACIEAADRARAADIRSLQKLRMQKQGVMHDLLTGKVRVPMPNPEAIA